MTTSAMTRSTMVYDAAGARDAGAAQAQSAAVSYCGDQRRPALERERRVDVEEQGGRFRTVQLPPGR